MTDQAQAFGLLIAASRQWAQERARLRRLADSKRATPQDVEKARQKLVAASNVLERTIRRFDKEVAGEGSPKKLPKLRQNPTDWGKIAGAVARIAGGVEKAVRPSNTEIIDAEVIDVKSSSVDS